MNSQRSSKAQSAGQPVEKQSTKNQPTKNQSTKNQSTKNQSTENQAANNQEIPMQPPPVIPPSKSPIQPKESPSLPTQSKPSQSKVPVWRFLIAMLIQSALIVAVPLKSAVTYANGQTVTLQTLPVDPYDLLRGYSQTLRFEISDPERLKQLPGAQSIFSELQNQSYASTPIFVILEAPKAATTDESADGKTPTAWEPIAVSKDYPENLSDNQVAIQGQAQGWRVLYGLETYYMPESQREEINEKITLEQQAEDSAFVVNVKIDSNGNSVPSSLWVRDEEFRF